MLTKSEVHTEKQSATTLSIVANKISCRRYTYPEFQQFDLNIEGKCQVLVSYFTLCRIWVKYLTAHYYLLNQFSPVIRVRFFSMFLGNNSVLIALIELSTRTPGFLKSGNVYLCL